MTSRAILNGWPIAPPSRRQSPPVNLLAPSISGTFAVGQTLTASAGSWDGFPTITYAYQWFRNGEPIPNATASTYTLVDADSGAVVYVAVTAINGYGGGYANSPSSTVTGGGTPPPTTYAFTTFPGASNAAIESAATETGNKSWIVTAANQFIMDGAGNLRANFNGGSSSPTKQQAVLDVGASDYTVETMMNSTHQSSTLFNLAELCLRYVDANNYTSFRLDSRTGEFSVCELVAGVETNLWKPTMTIASGQDFKIKIKAVGTEYIIFINDIEFAAIERLLNPLSTKVGIGALAQKSSATFATWRDFKVTNDVAKVVVFPQFTPDSLTTPVLALGATGSYDDRDANNPNVVYDPVGNRWVMYYSGYKAGNSNVQNMCLAYAPYNNGVPDGPWTKDPANPVVNADGTDGYYGFNGGLTYGGGMWISPYGSVNGSKISLLTGTSLASWTRRGVVVDTTEAWNTLGVSDAFIRNRQSGGYELWYGGNDANGRRFGRSTSADGITYTKDANNPIFVPPASFFSQGLGELSQYVPTGKEGQEWLFLFDAVIKNGSSNYARTLHAAITVDGGATYHWKIDVLKTFGTGFASKQVFDSFMLDDGKGTMHLFHGASDTYGPALDLNIQVGRARAAWSRTTLKG